MWSGDAHPPIYIFLSARDSARLDQRRPLPALARRHTVQQPTFNQLPFKHNSTSHTGRVRDRSLSHVCWQAAEQGTYNADRWMVFNFLSMANSELYCRSSLRYTASSPYIPALYSILHEQRLFRLYTIITIQSIPSHAIHPT